MGNFLQRTDVPETKKYNFSIKKAEENAIENINAGRKTENNIAQYLAVQKFKDILNDHGQDMEEKECTKLLWDNNIRTYAGEIENSEAFKDLIKDVDLTSISRESLDEIYKQYSSSSLSKAKEPSYTLMTAERKAQITADKQKAQKQMAETNAKIDKKNAAEAKAAAKKKAAQEKAAAKKKAAEEKAKAKKLAAEKKAEAKRLAAEKKAEAKRKAAEEKARKAEAKKKAAQAKAEAKKKAAAEKAEAKRKAAQAKAAGKKKTAPAKTAPAKTEVAKQAAPEKRDYTKDINAHREKQLENASNRYTSLDVKIADLMAIEKISRELFSNKDSITNAAQIGDALTGNKIKSESLKIQESDKFKQFIQSQSEDQLKEISKNTKEVEGLYDSYNSFVPAEPAPKDYEAVFAENSREHWNRAKEEFENLKKVGLDSKEAKGIMSKLIDESAEVMYYNSAKLNIESFTPKMAENYLDPNVKADTIKHMKGAITENMKGMTMDEIEKAVYSDEVDLKKAQQVRDILGQQLAQEKNLEKTAQVQKQNQAPQKSAGNSKVL